ASRGGLRDDLDRIGAVRARRAGVGSPPPLSGPASGPPRRSPGIAAHPAVDSGCIFMHHARLFMHRRIASLAAPARLDPVDMAAEIHQSVARRAAILRIIGESTVHNQDELVKVLRKQGFDATQSSVSRDLRELGVAKAGDRYILPARDAATANNPFAAVVKFVLEIKTAGTSLTVLKTTTGTAQSVAVAIDGAEWPEVV